MKKLLLTFVLGIFLAATSMVYLPAEKASAGGWTNITGNAPDVSTARICKIYMNSAYGPLYRFNYQVFRENGWVLGISVDYLRNGRYYDSNTNYGWYYGVVSGTYGYASILNGDGIRFTTIVHGGQHELARYSQNEFYKIAYC